jgi:hypothetical protein
MLAIFGAVFASVSSSGGLLTWFALAPAVLVLGWRSISAWSIAALAIIVSYMKDFPTGTLTSTNARETLALPSFSDATGFTFAYLGAPIGYPSVSLSQAFGILSLIVLASNVAYLAASSFSTPRERRTLLVWIGLACFALFTAVVVMIGRGKGFGLGAALWSRFHAFSVLWWIALIVLSAASFVNAQQSSPSRTAAHHAKRRPVCVFNAGALFIAGLGLMYANLIGFNHAVAYLAPYQQNQYCVFNYENASDECLSTYHPNVARLRERTAYLAQHRFAFFDNIDRIENTAKVPPTALADTGLWRTC